MSENNEAPQEGTEQAPVFRMQKMFIKDLSFENPNAPAIFLENSQSPKVDINLHVKNHKLDDSNWEVSLAITASFKGEEDKTIFIIEIEHAGIFLLAYNESMTNNSNLKWMMWRIDRKNSKELPLINLVQAVDSRPIDLKEPVLARTEVATAR